MLVFMGTYTFMQVLREIADLYEDKENPLFITLTTLAKHLDISQSALRHHIKKLDEKKWISFAKNPFDNRTKLIKVTINGHQALEYYTDFYDTTQRSTKKTSTKLTVKEENLTAEEKRELTEFLSKK